MKKFRKISIVLLSFALIISSNSLIAYAYDIFMEKCEAKITSDLAEYITEKENDDEIKVGIWFDTTEIINTSTDIYDSYGFDKMMPESYNIVDSDYQTTIDEIHDFREKLCDAVQNKCSTLNEKYINSLSDDFDITYVSDTAPYIVANIKKKDINKIIKNSNTHYVMSTDIEFEPLMDISAKTTKARTVQNNGALGYTGKGIRIGIIEASGYPDITVDALKNSNITSYSSTPIDYHATNVAEIMVSKGSGKVGIGVAPDAELYCACAEQMNYEYSLDWLIKTCKVDIINLSMYFKDSEMNTYDIFSVITDYYSQAFLTTFVLSAGNEGKSGITSPAMSYNAIAVGNLYDNSTASISDDYLNGTSSYYNTVNPTYASKPDIVAPGSPIKLESGSCTGTSYSAPHVAGAIALIGQQDPIVLVSPSAAKAIITAGVYSSKLCFVPSQRIVSNSNIDIPESYIQYGAGILNCVGNAVIVNNENYDFGIFEASEDYYDVAITCNANQKVRVSLAFEKNVKYSKYTYDAEALNNLDLKVYNSSKQLVASSTTTYNNLEIVDFTPTTTGKYTIRIERGNSSSSTSVRFAYAWI